MKKEHFIGSIGYDGEAAVVDKARMNKNKGKSLRALLDEGAFRTAAALAIFNDSQEEIEEVIAAYNKISGSNYKSSQIFKLFGIYKSDVKKILAL